MSKEKVPQQMPSLEDMQEAGAAMERGEEYGEDLDGAMPELQQIIKHTPADERGEIMKRIRDIIEDLK